jgi:hypothetical protein
MKLSHLLQINEAPAQQHELTAMLHAAVKEIPDDIYFDFKNAAVDYPKEFFMDGNSSLFDSHGKCMAEPQEILDYAKNEKLKMLVGGYDPEYEEMFICQKSPELVIKRLDDYNFTVTFRQKKFNMSRAELQKVIDAFDVGLAEYERIKDRKDPADDFDEDAPRWATRAALDHARRRRQVEDDGYERDLDETDFNFTKSKLAGSFVYLNLYHT